MEKTLAETLESITTEAEALELAEHFSFLLEGAIARSGLEGTPGLEHAPSLRRERSALSSHRGTVLAGAVLIYPLAFYSSMHLAGVAVGTVVSLGSAPIASGPESTSIWTAPSMR